MPERRAATLGEGTPNVDDAARAGALGRRLIETAC
jgi:hypothetical protein